MLRTSSCKIGLSHLVLIDTLRSSADIQDESMRFFMSFSQLLAAAFNPTLAFKINAAMCDIKPTRSKNHSCRKKKLNKI